MLTLGCGDPEFVSSESRILRVSLPAAPSALDPHLQDEWASRTILSHVYDSLVALDANMKVAPQLAERWETVGQLTWRFHIRHDVKFQDGRPLTADDVVASLRRSRHHPGSEISSYLLEVESVEKLGDWQVEIRTRRPYPILLNKLSFVAIVPQDAPSVIEAPVGTGPYRIESHSGDEIILRAFDNYWGSIPPIKRVSFLFLNNHRNRLEAFLRGDIDLIYSFVVADLADFPDVLDQQFVSEPGLYIAYLQFRVDRPPFNDLRIRQAINLAIDRERLVEDAAEGAAQPASQLLSPQIFGYVPDLPVTQADPVKARALLEEAGYPDGIDLNIHLREGRTGQALIAQLNEVGIRLNPTVMAWPDLYAKLQTGEVDFYLGSWGCPSGDASELFDNKVHTLVPGGPYGTSNSMGYSNPILDGFIEDASATFSVEERKAVFARAMSILQEDLPIIPLLVDDYIYLVSPDVEWTSRLDGRVLAQEMSFR